MEKKLFVTELKPYLYLLDEAHEATGYLVIGEHRSCVIDTMMGYNDLRKAVRGITDKPLVVVNTHGHPDHIYGNVYFEEAYMNLNDEQVAARYIDDPEFQEDCRKRGLSMPPFQDIHGGDVIDLGGKTLEVYDLPGIEEIVLYKKTGDVVDGTKSSNDRLGHIIATGKDAREAFERATDVLNRIKVHYAE